MPNLYHCQGHSQYLWCGAHDCFVPCPLPVPTVAGTGDLVYIDSFCGLIPAKITSVTDDEDGHLLVSVKITANRKAFKRGEIETYNPFSIVPRSCVRTRRGQYRIDTNYVFRIDAS